MKDSGVSIGGTRIWAAAHTQKMKLKLNTNVIMKLSKYVLIRPTLITMLLFKLLSNRDVSSKLIKEVFC